jgi:hypothetical protein
LLYGWCPNRQIHLQHATTKQLLETNLVNQNDWNNYFKFTFVRNPWDRTYSSYLWVMKDRKIKDSFRNFILGKGLFKNVLRNGEDMYNRACHKWEQSVFFNTNEDYKVDFIGHFENLEDDIRHINKILGVEKKFNHYSNKSEKRVKHYSLFYDKKNSNLIKEIYKKDIEKLKYTFCDKKNRFQKLTSKFINKI